MSGAAPATVLALGATLSHPAGRALAPLPLAPARRALAVVRTTLLLRTPVAGAVHGHPAEPAEATAATTSATVGPGLPKIECSKFCQFSCCPCVLLCLGSLCKNIRVKPSTTSVRYSKCTYYLVGYGQSLVVESSSAKNGLHQRLCSVRMIMESVNGQCLRVLVVVANSMGHPLLVSFLLRESGSTC